MGNKISGEITPAIKTTVEGLATGAKAAMPFLRNATKKERETLPKMGLQRAGFVDKAYAGALAHTNKLPGDFDMAEFTKDAKLKVDLPYIRQIFVDMVELVDDTSLLLGNDLIMQANYVYNHFKLVTDNEDIKTLVAELGAEYKGLGIKKSASTFTLPESVTITVTKVVTGKILVNDGTTVVQFKPGADLAGKVREAQPITVHPGDSAIIPKGWSSIEVTNLSATTQGSFTVKVK